MRSLLKFLSFALLPILIIGCKKTLLEGVGGLLISPEDLLEDRPEGTVCESEGSTPTLDNGGLTFDSSHVLCVDIQMKASDFEVMRKESRFGPSIDYKEGATVIAILFEYLNQCDVPWPSKFNWYQADVSVDGISLENVGVRKKGFLGSIFSPAPSLRIHTNRFSDQYIGQTNQITLNNNSEDETRVRSCINFKVFEWAGYPAPLCNLANLSVNGELLGPYSHLEGVDESFLLRAFGNNEGHLYEGQLADLVAEWLPRWDAKTDQTDPLALPLMDIIGALEVSDDQLVEELGKQINLDRFITFWALEYLLEHEDGYCVNRNNFYIYINPEDQGRATFIPWGMNYFNSDLLSEEDQGINSYVAAELPRRLSRIPEIAERFESRLTYLLDSVWKEDQLISLIDHFASQVSEAQVDEDYEASIGDLRDWVLNRRRTVEEELSAGLPMGNEKRVGSCHQ